MKPRNLHIILLSTLAAAAGLAAHTPAHAGPATSVYTPIVENGETEFEYKGGWREYDGGLEEHASVFEIGRGVNDHWFTELELEQSFEDGGPNHLESVEWENKFVFTERGKYWLDVGLFAAYEHTFDPHDPDEIKIGPMFMKDIGPVTANVNLLFERKLGSGASSDTDLGYQWQVRWHGREALEFGLQGMGDVGALGHLGQDQSHIAGPVLFGAHRTGSGKIKWNAGVLAGLDRSAPNVTVRAQIEYEMH